MWRVIRASVRQLRMSEFGPIGLDFGAVLALGAAMGADAALLADLLPAMEKAALDRLGCDRGVADDDEC